MGYDMEEGTVVRWLVPEDSEVKTGDAVAEIETDKAVVELESTGDGLLRKILVQEGTTVPVGQTIAVIAERDDEIPEVYTSDPITPDVPPIDSIDENFLEIEQEDTTSLGISTSSEETHRSSEVRASPVAKRLALERAIDLTNIKGTGPGGRITKDDVLSFEPSEGISETLEIDMTPYSKSEEVPDNSVDIDDVEMESPVSLDLDSLEDGVTPLTKMRQQIARVTSSSKKEKPHFYVSAEIDMTEALGLRRKINSDMSAEGIKVTVNDMVIKASAGALSKFPKFNSTFTDAGIKFNTSINIGVAIAEEEGLVLPAILDCQEKSLAEVSVSSKDLVKRSQDGTLQAHEYTGGTFGISNMGMFDVSSFVAIIHPPNTAMLAVGRIEKRPVVREDQVTIADMMSATLSVDHRVVDGVEGAKFIVEVKRLLENPLSLLV